MSAPRARQELHKHPRTPRPLQDLSEAPQELLRTKAHSTTIATPLYDHSESTGSKLCRGRSAREQRFLRQHMREGAFLSHLERQRESVSPETTRVLHSKISQDRGESTITTTIAMTLHTVAPPKTPGQKSGRTCQEKNRPRPSAHLFTQKRQNRILARPLLGSMSAWRM